jgi:glucose/arabinose dehydrogenase
MAFALMAILTSAFLPLLWINQTAYAAPPAGFSDKLVAAGLDLPVTMEFAPDGRLFVSEKDGALRVIKDGALLEQPFATLAANSEGERGLQGIAFDPDFDRNGYVYVYYTTASEPVHNRVSRLTADPANPDRMLAGSERAILDLEPLVTVSHNGGALDFGPDGKLYVSTGDNYHPHLAQSLTSRLGKILRINPDGTVPSDNPFYRTQGAYREIWALGLRNPFSFAFSESGDRMHINDVGQDTWEEVNAGFMGANYGWPLCEGRCSEPGLADPVHTYQHPADESGSSVAGGAFYEASQFPAQYRGSYFFGDYVRGFIKMLTPDGEEVDFLTGVNSPVDIEVGPEGHLYYLSIGAGEVRRVQFTTAGNYEPVAMAPQGRRPLPCALTARRARTETATR